MKTLVISRAKPSYSVENVKITFKGIEIVGHAAGDSYFVNLPKALDKAPTKWVAYARNPAKVEGIK